MARREIFSSSTYVMATVASGLGVMAYYAIAPEAPWVGVGVGVGALAAMGSVKNAWHTVLEKAKPSNRRQACRAAGKAFRQGHPDKKIHSIALRGVFQERYVISVRYGRSDPPERMYYSVSKHNFDVAKAAEHEIQATDV